MRVLGSFVVVLVSFSLGGVGSAAAQAAAPSCTEGRQCGNAAFDTWDHDREAALKLHTRACDRGYGKSCAALGQIREEGIVGAVDVKAAVRLYQKACTLGAAAGCHNLGSMHHLGKGIKVNAAAAKKLMQRGCSLGFSQSCDALVAIAGGTTAPTDHAVRCERGDTASCVQAGYLLEDGQSDDDPARALALYQRACKLGNLDGCVEVAARDEVKDVKRARVTYERACDAGVAFACGQLGRLYESGRMPRTAGGKSLVWYFELACPEKQARDVGACEWLANKTDGLVRLEGGLSNKPISAVAAERPLAFSRRACEEESVLGCRLLANLHTDLGHVRDAFAAAAAGCTIGDVEMCKVGAAADTARSATWTKCGEGDAASCQTLLAPTK